VITPRHITLHRVADLFAFRTVLADWLAALSPEQARETCVVVPTYAAAEQLRRTIEERALGAERAALVWPIVATRRDVYQELTLRLSPPRDILSAFEREAVLTSVARSTLASGIELPYELRPGLIVELLAFYDHLRRLGRTIDDFERNFRAELEPEQDTDRGARRLLQQTVFLAASYRAYEERLRVLNRCDEHALRELVVRTPLKRPLQRVIVTVGDRVVEGEGLWPADFDLLARLPGLQDVDIVCTEAVLASGYLERLFGAFPDLTEERPSAPSRARPTIAASPERSHATDAMCFSYRDREEELIGVARRLKQQRRSTASSPLHRHALVVQRPLPYLYLARDVFRDAGVPFETRDTLPLAAEPYAAAVDLVLSAVAADFTRPALLELLRSPHFRFQPAGDPAGDWDVAIRALGSALAEARYLGGLERLQVLAAAWTSDEAPRSREERRQRAALPALGAMVGAMTPLAPIATIRPMVDQIGLLLEWLDRFDEPTHPGPERSRRLRVRAAVVDALRALRNAYADHDPAAEGDVATLTAALRRWLEAQTFAMHSGEPGIQIVDARAARYGDFDDIQILGLVDGEWPERTRRSVLYPSSLLALLEPAPGVFDPTTRERDALRSGVSRSRGIAIRVRAAVDLRSRARRRRRTVAITG
jgi:hypothetical protein